MKFSSALVLAVVWALVLAAFFGCETSMVRVPIMVVDTVSIPMLTWVGGQVRWADEILNNDVQVKILAGWDCEMVMTMPYWLPIDGENTMFALTMYEFFICTVPDWHGGK